MNCAEIAAQGARDGLLLVLFENEEEAIAAPLSAASERVTNNIFGEEMLTYRGPDLI